MSKQKHLFISKIARMCNHARLHQLLACMLLGMLATRISRSRGCKDHDLVLRVLASEAQNRQGRNIASLTTALHSSTDGPMGCWAMVRSPAVVFGCVRAAFAHVLLHACTFFCHHACTPLHACGNCSKQTRRQSHLHVAPRGCDRLLVDAAQPSRQGVARERVAAGTNSSVSHRAPRRPALTELLVAVHRFA